MPHLRANNHATNSLDRNVFKRLAVHSEQNVAHLNLSRAAMK